MWRAAEGRRGEWWEVLWKMVENCWGGWRNQLLWRTCRVPLSRFQTRVGGSEGTKGGKGKELESEVCHVQKACATSTQSDLPLSPHFAKRAVRVLQAWPLPWERLCCSVRTTHIACQSPEIAPTPTIHSVNSDSTPGSASAKSFGPVVNAPMVGRLVIGMHEGRDAEGRHYIEVQGWVE